MKMRSIIFKKVLLFFAAIFLLILVIGIWTAKKLPTEARFLMKHLNSEEIMKDMINDPEKYKKQSCFEVEFNKEKYCFDRSRVYFEKKYIDSATKEDESASIYFLPKALSNFPSEDREVMVYLKVDKYHRNDVNEPERFVKNWIKKDITYGDLMKISTNGNFYEITNNMEGYWISGFNEGNKYFIYHIDKRIIMKIDIKSSNKYYAFIADALFQAPKERNYFEIHIVSNQSTQQEFLQTTLDIAQEFNQFLSDSKISNKSL